MENTDQVLLRDLSLIVKDLKFEFDLGDESDESKSEVLQLAIQLQRNRFLYLALFNKFEDKRSNLAAIATALEK